MVKVLHTAKERMRKHSPKKALVVAGLASAIAPGYCTGTANTNATNVVNMVFNLIAMSGLVMIAVGVVQLVRCIISLSSGDQLQPGQLGKAIGMVIAGIVAAGLKAILTALGISTTVKITG